MSRLFSMIVVCLLFILFASVDNHTLLSVANSFVNKLNIVECNRNDDMLVLLAEDYDEIIDILNLEISESCFIENRWVVEGFSNKINNYIVIDGKRVNVQIAVFGGFCIVGCPLIKNSF